MSENNEEKLLQQDEEQQLNVKQQENVETHEEADQHLDDQADSLRKARQEGDLGIVKTFQSIVADKLIVAESQSTMMGAAINVANTTMGAGILALPLIMKVYGIIIGALILFMIYVFITFTSSLLLKAKEKTGKNEYFGLSSHIFGKKGENICRAIIIVNVTGVCIIYFIVIGDTIDKLFDQIQGEDNRKKFIYKRWFYQVLIAFLMIPFTLAKSTEKLKFVSLIAVVCICIFAFVTIYAFIHNAIKGKIENMLYPHFDPVTAMMILPSVFTAFNYHQNLFPIYKNLQDGTPEKMMQVVKRAQIFTTVTYITLASFGVLSYGTKTVGNVLVNMNKKDIDFLYYIVFVAYIFVCALSLPIVFFTGRNQLMNIFQEYVFTRYKNKTTITFHITFTLIMYAIIVFLGIILKDITMVFGFVGSICSNSISYIMPSLFYLYIGEKGDRTYTYAKCILIFGICAACVGILGQILKFAGFAN